MTSNYIPCKHEICCDSKTLHTDWRNGTAFLIDFFNARSFLQWEMHHDSRLHWLLIVEQSTELQNNIFVAKMSFL